LDFFGVGELERAEDQARGFECRGFKDRGHEGCLLLLLIWDLRCGVQWRRLPGRGVERYPLPRALSTLSVRVPLEVQTNATSRTKCGFFPVSGDLLRPYTSRN
jgi:hypothetical protein